MYVDSVDYGDCGAHGETVGHKESSSLPFEATSKIVCFKIVE